MYGLIKRLGAAGADHGEIQDQTRANGNNNNNKNWRTLIQQDFCHSLTKQINGTERQRNTHSVLQE